MKTERKNASRKRFTSNQITIKKATNLILQDSDVNKNTAYKSKSQAKNDVTQTTFWVVLGMMIGPITALLLGFFLSNTASQILEN